MPGVPTPLSLLKGTAVIECSPRLGVQESYLNPSCPPMAKGELFSVLSNCPSNQNWTLPTMNEEVDFARILMPSTMAKSIIISSVISRMSASAFESTRINLISPESSESGSSTGALAGAFAGDFAAEGARAVNGALVGSGIDPPDPGGGMLNTIVPLPCANFIGRPT
jgi:hypothetical protein